MKCVWLLILTTVAALPAGAADVHDCRGVDALATLYDIRSLMIRRPSAEYAARERIDRRIDDLREPLAHGGFRWVRYMRPSADGAVAKKGHNVVAIHDRDDSDSFEASSDHVFAVRIAVPQKKSLFSANNAVYVGSVRIDYTVDGRTKSLDRSINAWMSPDTSKTFDLGVIADRVDVSIASSTNARTSKESLIEIQLRQAVSDDDPDNPEYPTIRLLQRLRSNLDPQFVDNEIASLERELFPQHEPFPMLTFVESIRRADKMLRSDKPEDQEKGRKLMREAMRRIE
jgi:hypothetical protein